MARSPACAPQGEETSPAEPFQIKSAWWSLANSQQYILYFAPFLLHYDGRHLVFVIHAPVFFGSDLSTGPSFSSTTELLKNVIWWNPVKSQRSVSDPATSAGCSPGFAASVWAPLQFGNETVCLILSANGTKQPLARQVSGFMTAGGEKKNIKKERRSRTMKWPR